MKIQYIYTIIGFFFLCLKFESSLKENQYENYISYHEKIRQALVSLKDSLNHNKAVDEFNEAFEMVEKPWGIDVFDALQAAIQANRKTEMFTYSRILVTKSCDSLFFEQERLKALKTYPNEWQSLMEFIKKVHQNPSEYWNIELRERIITIRKKDPELGKNPIYNNDSIKDKYGAWILSPEYYENVRLPFIKIIKEHGLQSELTLGLTIQDDTLLTCGTCSEIIILHLYQSAYNIFSADELENFEKKGLLSPAFVSQLKSFQMGNRLSYPHICEMIELNAPEDSILHHTRMLYIKKRYKKQ
jgi:hypothetical protein